jgi:hypothetical protein
VYLVTTTFYRSLNGNAKIIKNKAMGLVREPEGVDFVIKSRPLTKREELLLSEFIQEYKAKRKKKPAMKKTSLKKGTSTRKKATAKKED